MKIEQFRQALEVYHCGSINKAARKLYISQPCISASLKALEKELGQKIFVRTYQGMELTEFGKVFMENAGQIAKYADQIEKAANRMPESKLEFSASVSFLLFAYKIFGRILEKYEKFPSDFRYNQTNVSNVIRDVKDKVAEVGLISIPTIDKEKWLAEMERDQLCYECIYREQPSAMLSADNPRAKTKDDISVEELAQMTFVVIAEGDKRYDQINQQMKEYLHASRVVEVNDRETAHEFICSHDAYACVVRCEYAYEKLEFFTRMRTRRMKEMPFAFEIGWLYRKDVKKSRIAEEFMTEINQLMRELKS